MDLSSTPSFPSHKHLANANPAIASTGVGAADAPPPTKKKSRRGGDPSLQKRQCVSIACIACRRRKSKCDGALPSCAACASVYGTECVYDPNSDHRRKGVYREKNDSMKASSSTLQILIEAILNAEEDEVHDIVKRIRTCDNLDTIAESIHNRGISGGGEAQDTAVQSQDDYTTEIPIEGERDLARKMGELRVENGTTRFIGGTSHLIHWDVMGSPTDEQQAVDSDGVDFNPITSWSNVTNDPDVVIHLLNMYFNWHYPYFTTLSRNLFYRDFLKGRRHVASHKTAYCSSLLVNAMLALGCHFTNVASAYAIIGDSWTKGDHFFGEAKRLIVDNDEYEKPRLTTVQALVLMSVREAGCGREAKGWVYSGMSFRMAQDLGLNMNLGGINGDPENLDEKEVDARRVTFWGCFLFDKCWSNYMGRLPQLPQNSYSVPKYDVFPEEDAEGWCPYTDAGFDENSKQPARTRTIGLQLSTLCEISSDLLLFFYHPNHIGRSSGKAVELKKLSELHRRLEEWHKRLPAELEPKDGQLPNVILMHMFFHLQYIHLFRPFLRYAPKTSPLPPHVSPRRICTAHAGAISKLMRLYKKTYNLRQICNIAVYMLHSACTIHLLNLPEKTAKRDIIHGIKHLEEIAEDWLCGRRSLSIISVSSRKWRVELPDEAAQILQRTDERWGTFNTSDVPSPRSHIMVSATSTAKNTPSPKQGHGSQSPQGHFMPSPPAQSSPHTSNSSIPPEPLVSAILHTPGFQSRPPVAGQIINNSGVVGTTTVDLSGLNSPHWQPSAINEPVSHYHQSYVPFPSNSQAGEGSQNLPSRNITQPVMQNSIFVADGNEWHMKDSASWHSGFDVWNAGNVSQPPTTMSDQQLFLFTSGGHSPADPNNPAQLPTEVNFDGLSALSSMDAWDLSNLE
ncbi:putative nitrogen assimilation transcription factor nit-4 [Rosellinia necatrix]|uniref:Putative nitrogen assimilation transcription factor nit-4 n=1 Tax=Rosellinia necatrix TaxID=77044 RepID=A0A1W2TDA9_ROSNE|nr:putative nitrogen assimilation transcription factor nit-4 [Rosellinia necatrix]